MRTLLILALLSGIALAAVTGEITEITEVAAGIINVRVEYKDGEKLLEERTYTIADSNTAIAAFQNEVLPKELSGVKAKKASGEYEASPEAIEEKAVKSYSIKPGDKIK
ncbi:MAG: hypothetical protein PHQ54_05245 [Candidatus Omnitrophica bacterium]|nr:hypothetical protein [Candidatus Omnitrophota bacterium]